MPPMLQYGSVGPYVAQLQDWLNKLPSDLDPLEVDGNYGRFTTDRVSEFQEANDLDVDGVAGPLTWDEIYDVMNQLFHDPTLGQRLRVVGVARVEAQLGSYVKMKLGQGMDYDDPQMRQYRQGYDRVLNYFRTSLSARDFQTYQDDVIHLTTWGQVEPMLHWCGIFALWAIKTACISGLGNWVVGSGISSVSGFRATSTPRVGDVGYIDNGFNHHVILADDPFVEGMARKIRTIEGNSDPNSNFNFKTRLYSEVGAFFTCY
jgi:peptidoglycan hydrolase-like protein with peptidoglycan-binding domain